MPIYDIHGVKTHILQGGSGPPLVYWHGAGGCGRWFPHHELLAQRYTVYAPDHPGWGQSDVVDWMDTIHDYTLHNDALFRALKIKRPILVGHSLGGWMAADFAATYPDRLKALILVNAAGFPFEADAPVPDFFAAANRGGEHFARLLFHKMDVAQAFFPSAPTPEEIITNYRHLTSTARLAWHLWFDEKLPKRLARVQSPMMALWGEHDRLFPASMAAQYAESVPNGLSRLISDCGHMLPFENPQALLDAIVDLDPESAGPSALPTVEGASPSALPSVEGAGLSALPSVEGAGLSALPSVEGAGLSALPTVEGAGPSAPPSVEGAGLSALPSVEGAGPSALPSVEGAGPSALPSVEAGR